MEDLRVAAVTMRSAVGKKEQNLSRMESWVRRASGQKAQVVCFPELNLSGYSLRQPLSTLAEPIPGPGTEAAVKMARENGVVILAGLVEQDKGKIFISHFAAAPQGLLGAYRKIHLGPPEEGLYEAGGECPVFHYGPWHFAMELCFDAHFPELSTLLALGGAEIIFIPHASPRESAGQKRERWLRYLAARAYDNSVFVVACNQVGETESGLPFSGAALVLNPRGEVLAANSGGGEEMILADLKAAAFTGVRESPMGFFLSRRRPEIYKVLSGEKKNGSAC